MPTKKLQKLLQASEAANDRDTQHILLSIPADGKVSAAGSDSLVTCMVSENNVQPGKAGIELDIDNEGDLDEHLDEHVLIYDIIN